MTREGASPPDEAAIIAANFDGDAALYAATRPVIVAQLRCDLDAGDAALHAGDAERMRRVAHDMKSALRLIGQAAAAALAREVEFCADRGDAALGASVWARLREAVQRLR